MTSRGSRSAALAGLALAGCVLALHAVGDRAASFASCAALHLGATAAFVFLVSSVVRGAFRPTFLQAFVGALLLRALFVPLAPALSDDIYRYLWEGRLVLEGINPYLAPPNAESLAHLRDTTWSSINNPDIPAAYPPAVQYALAAGAFLGGGALGMKLVFGGLDLALFVALWFGLPRLGIARERAVVHGWCPLLALEFAGEAHSDSLAVLATVLALFAFARGRWLSCGVALAVAVAGKLMPIVLLPFVLRHRDGWRVAGAFVVVLVGLYLPFAAPFEELFRGTLEYAGRWRSNDSLFAVIHAVVDRVIGFGWFAGLGPWFEEPQRLAKFVLATLAAAVLLRSWRAGHDPWRAARAFFLFFIAFAPTLHPWYVAFLVPFLARRADVGLLAFTGTVYFAYHVLPAWLAEQRWEESWPVKLAEYAPFYAALLLGSRIPSPDPLPPPG